MRSLVKEALDADAEIDKSGQVFRAADVHAWMNRLAAGGSTARPESDSRCAHRSGDSVSRR
jgi:hypothetical protein